MSARTKILVVEGNATQELLTLLAIKNSGIECDVQVVRDGIEACLVLFDRTIPSPTLVLMELNLPKLNGCEVLCRIRNHFETKVMPVIIFTESNSISDIEHCLDLHANSYVVKDKDLERNETRLKLLLYYWVAVNQNVNS